VENPWWKEVHLSQGFKVYTTLFTYIIYFGYPPMFSIFIKVMRRGMHVARIGEMRKAHKISF